MTKGYGIKVSRPGFSVHTGNPEELAFSSAYKTLKIHAQGNGSLTHSARTVTIAHNLGYVPFFLVHSQLDPAVASTTLVGSNTDYFISPFRLGTALDVWEAENTHDVIAWADTTNLYVRARANVGKEFYVVSGYNTSGHDRNQCMAEEDGGGTDLGWWEVGYDSISGTNHGALRFGPSGISLTQGQSIYSATLGLYIGGRNGSGEIKMKIYGIDEDDTVAFNSGTPATARAKTTANTTSNTTASQGNTLGIDVTSLVQEIVDRAGWASGNQIGFIMNDNGTSSGNGSYYEDSSTGDPASYLEIMKSSSLASFKYTIFKNQLE